MKAEVENEMVVIEFSGCFSSGLKFMVDEDEKFFGEKTRDN